mmetsp:Transcript_22167/g.69391  ORF Transcript_22167/g.69391 Transcript_22167/m.69391 type:complete len:188 (+) Transcript_22167:186-749(+)
MSDSESDFEPDAKKAKTETDDDEEEAAPAPPPSALTMPATVFNGKPPIFEPAKSGRAACKVCGTIIEKGAARVGLPIYQSGRTVTAWIKAACFAEALTVAVASDNRSKCKASGDKISKGDLRVVARIASSTELAEGGDGKGKVFYKPSAIVPFLTEWMAEAEKEAKDIPGFDELPDAAQSEFLALFA